MAIKNCSGAQMTCLYWRVLAKISIFVESLAGSRETSRISPCVLHATRARLLMSHAPASTYSPYSVSTWGWLLGILLFSLQLPFIDSGALAVVQTLQNCTVDRDSPQFVRIKLRVDTAFEIGQSGSRLLCEMRCGAEKKKCQEACQRYAGLERARRMVGELVRTTKDVSAYMKCPAVLDYIARFCLADSHGSKSSSDAWKRKDNESKQLSCFPGKAEYRSQMSKPGDQP